MVDALTKDQVKPVVVGPGKVPQIAERTEGRIRANQTGCLTASSLRRVNVGLRRLGKDGTAYHLSRFIVVPAGVKIEGMRSDVLSLGCCSLPQLLPQG